MTEDMAASLRSRPSLLEQTLEVFLRAMALVCIVEGVAYWIRLLGFFDGSAWRFDLMPIYWQMTAVPLAVLFPFAAVGLWMLASWGPVVWILCAGTEIVMYGAFPDLFGNRAWLLGFQLLMIGCYAGLRIVLYLRGTHSRR